MKHPLSLHHPCLPGQKAQVVKADGRCFAAAGQAFEDLRRQIGEAQLAADMALGVARAGSSSPAPRAGSGPRRR